jgi:NAD(P)-dependent dehydrogenase (short-subunit alcohol dehydrogenase family)
MSTSLPHKVALITGGTRGIGLGIARALASSGFALALNGVRPVEDVEPVLDDLRAAGADVHYLRGDVSRLAAHEAMLDEIDSRFGGLHVLVNNAGVAPSPRADVLEATPESFDRLISINLRGPYFLTQAVAKRMIRLRQSDPTFRGRIINVSSISAAVASMHRGDYCISKAGVAMATQLWAARLAEHDIDVYEVRPGVIATDMTAPVRHKYDAHFASGTALARRWGTPEDVGKAVAVLARGDMPYATGQVLTIDGGMTIPRL